MTRDKAIHTDAQLIIDRSFYLGATSLLLRQKQNKMFQSISICEIFNSVDVVHKNIFGFARAQIRSNLGPGGRSKPRADPNERPTQPAGYRCSPQPSGIINIDDRETRAPPNLADAPRGRTPPTQSPARPWEAL